MFKPETGVRILNHSHECNVTGSACVRCVMKRIAVAGLVLGALFISGCTSNESGAPTSAEAPGRDFLSAGDGSEKSAANPAGAPGEQDAGKAPNATAAPEGRALIYRGDMTIRVEEVEAAAVKVEALATSLKGHLASEKRSLGSQSAYASITIRVPSESYATAMQRLSKEIGREESRSSNTEDVTEAVVDLDTRIAAAKASVESVRRLFDRPGLPMNEIVLLEKELSSRQAELASLEAKKRRLSDLVAMSTITVNLAGPNTVLPEKPKERAPGFLGGLQAGWDAFLSVGAAIIYVVAYLLPFAAVILLLGFGLSRLLRLRRERVTTTASPPSTQD